MILYTLGGVGPLTHALTDFHVSCIDRENRLVDVLCQRGTTAGPSSIRKLEAEEGLGAWEDSASRGGSYALCRDELFAASMSAPCSSSRVRGAIDQANGGGDALYGTAMHQPCQTSSWKLSRWETVGKVTAVEPYLVEPDGRRKRVLVDVFHGVWRCRRRRAQKMQRSRV